MRDWILSCRVIRNRDLCMNYLVIAAGALCFGLVIGSEFSR
jgi:hypothetical protein